jgi:hypothetical protein
MLLRISKPSPANMWRQGAWPSALGFEIASLNVAGRFTSGTEAAYVRVETDKIIDEALRAQRTTDHAASFAKGEWIYGGTADLVARLVSRRDGTGRDRLRQLATEMRQVKHGAFAEIADQLLHVSHLASR